MVRTRRQAGNAKPDEEKTREELIGELRDLRAGIALARTGLFEERFRSLIRNFIDTSMDIIIAAGADGKIIEFNRTARDTFGMTRDESIGLHIESFFADRLQAERVFQTTLDRGRCLMEVDYSLRDGRLFHALLSASSLRDKNGVITGIIYVSRDITDYKNALDELRENEARFRALAETTTGAIFIWQDSRYCYVNPAMQSLSGFSEEELLNKEYWEIAHPDSRDWLKNIGQSRMDGADVPTRYELKAIIKDGSVRWFDVTSTRIKYRNRVAVLGTAFDITPYKEIEEDIRRKAAELEAIFQVQPDLFVRVRADWTVLDCKPWKESKIRIQAREYIGKNISDILPPKIAAQAIEGMRKVLSTGNLLETVFTHVTEFGSYYFEARLIPLFDTEIIAIVRDITEKRKHEEELLKAQHLESIGILAGGIAHDFNNILAAIQGNISLAKLYSAPDSRSYEKLIDTEHSIERAKDLTRQLLTFSIGGAPLKKVMSIYNILKDSVNFYLSGSDIRGEFFIPAPLWLVEIDEGQISQVINNIIINAIQAMQRAGVITIEAHNIDTEKDRALLSGHTFKITPGRYVMISIEDRGVGIPPEHLPRIFDPYFSLKDKGTGLGLATSYSIIKRHNGYIDVKSEPGCGTTVFLYLPASMAEKEIIVEPEAEARPITGKGRVLIMDDDASILRVCGELVRNLGYEALFARNGSETIDLYTESMKQGSKIDAIIMDLTIPGGMGGRDCVRRLIEIDPGVKAIVSSGYSNDPVMADYANYGFCGVILKPYRMEQLGRALHEALAAAT